MLQNFKVGVLRLTKININNPEELKVKHLKRIKEWMAQWTVENNYFPSAVFHTLCDPDRREEAALTREADLCIVEVGLTPACIFAKEQVNLFASSMQNALGIDYWTDCVFNNVSCFDFTFQFFYNTTGIQPRLYQRQAPAVIDSKGIFTLRV